MPMPKKANPNLPKLSATFQLLTTLITNLLLNLVCVWWLLDLARALHVVCTPVIVFVCVCVSPAYAQLEIFQLTNKLCALRPPTFIWKTPKGFHGMATTTKRQMRHETSTESVGGEAETFPQATSTPLGVGVNVLGDADLSPVIYKRQCDEGSGRCRRRTRRLRLAKSRRLADFWQLPHNCLATLARHSSTDKRGKPLWES